MPCVVPVVSVSLVIHVYSCYSLLVLFVCCLSFVIVVVVAAAVVVRVSCFSANCWSCVRHMALQVPFYYKSHVTKGSILGYSETGIKHPRHPVTSPDFGCLGYDSWGPTHIITGYLNV